MKISEVPALVLAGGLGTRLQSVISDLPKPMAPIGDKPFLHYLLSYLRSQGVRRVVLLVGHKADTIESHFGAGDALGLSIRYCREKDLLGTAGATKNAESLIESDTFLLLNGDTFFPVDLSLLLDYHLSSGGDSTLALKIKDDASRYGTVTITQDGLVSAFVEKSASARDGYINGGIYVIERRLLATIPPNVKMSLENDVFPRARLSGLPLPDPFIDIGIPSDYQRGQVMIPLWQERQSHKCRAVFLDRDGVINEDSGYPYQPEHIMFVQGIFESCATLRSRGFRLVVVTNQAGVAKGKYGEEEVPKLHRWMTEQFAARGIVIDDFLYCPFHEKATVAQYKRQSLYRKPEPGMVLDAGEKWNIDLAMSVVVGDKESDRIRLPYLRSIILKSTYTTVGYDCETLSDALRHPALV
jgi:D,D-heptose 1,7-bisphosphate phosphatase